MAAVDRALTSEAGARWFFAELVEPLCDSFDPAVQPWHDRLLATAVAECVKRHASLRRVWDGEAVGTTIAKRALSLPRTAVPHQGRPPDVCVIPSRVTIGADIAVTAAIAAVVRAAWPGVTIALVGAADQLSPLFGGLPGTEVWHQPYPRRGTFQDRLQTWVAATETVYRFRQRNPSARVLVLDPDSRITQLGLLPLAPAGGAERVFRSRCAPLSDRRSLGALATAWARTVCGLPASTPVRQRIRLPRADTAWGRQVVQGLRSRTGRPVVVASLGVGGNPDKSTTPEEEAEFLVRAGRRATVILDTGSTPAEVGRAERVAAACARHTGDPSPAIHYGQSVGRTGRVWSGAVVLLRGAPVTAVGGLIAAADAYLGYDSAFQHLAAALDVPAAALFINPRSPTFVDRWCSEGVTPVCVNMAVPARDRQVAAAVDTVLARLLKAV